MRGRARRRLIVRTPTVQLVLSQVGEPAVRAPLVGCQGVGDGRPADHAERPDQLREHEVVLRPVRDLLEGSVAAIPEELIPTEPANRTIAAGHDGAVLQSIDIEGLKHLAIRHDALIVMPMAVGDYLRKNSMVFALYGGASLPDDEQMLDHLALGSERSPEQDPTLALRVLVDISIKALSPAINDPTTGDHMLDRVEDLLVDMVQRDLDAGIVRDANNIPRLIYPTPTWEDVLQLGVTEIRLYGGSNPQICRRLHALYDNLLAVAPAYRRDSIEAERARLLRTIASQFPDPLDRELAMVSDTQGFGARGLLGAVRPPV